MPTLRIYFNALFESELENLEHNIANEIIEFDQLNYKGQSGFYKQGNIFEKILDTYYIANYIESGYKSLPSMNSELAYFNFMEEKEEIEEKYYPILIKIVINKQEGIMCFYSRQVLKNKEANDLIRKLHLNYGFNFKYSLIKNHYKFRRNELHTFLNCLEVDKFIAISVFDADNELIIKNSNSLTKTKKLSLFLEEMNMGNWSYVRLINSEFEFEIRLNNNKTQNFLTLENKYVDDIHLVKSIDYLTKKIKEAEKSLAFDGKKQTCLDYFQKIKI
jgi:hypothetical protein